MKYCLLILTCFFCSCNSEPDYDDYLKQMGVVLIDDFKVIEYNTDGAIGDFAVDFQLKISDKDFENIVAKIKQIENYGEYKRSESPNSFSIAEKGYHISGFKLADKYFYRKENTSKPFYYELVAGANNTLHFKYIED
jgi:hypothetical protein